MSIIIKGMKMPQKEGDYNALLHVNRDGTALFSLYKERGVYAAKELPPHGRLIDADALEEESCDVVADMGWDAEFGYSHDQIRNAPTIIEAEEAEQ